MSNEAITPREYTRLRHQNLVSVLWGRLLYTDEVRYGG